MTTQKAIEAITEFREVAYGHAVLAEALDMAIEALQQSCEKVAEGCDDYISRQAAIDIERNVTVDTNPSHFEAHQKFTQFMDDVEISSFGRWQWSNGFNTALTAVGIDLKKLPSAQPEIIRCKDCKHSEHWYRDKRRCFLWQETGIDVFEDGYCNYAERKDDE